MAAIEHATALALAEALRINAADDLEGERIGDESPEAFVVRKILEASGLPDQLRGAVEENARLRELYENVTGNRERFGWTIDHLLECEEALRVAEEQRAEADMGEPVSIEQLYAAASLVAAAKDFRELGVRPGAIEEFVVRSDLNPVTSDESLAYGIVIGVLAAKLRF